MGAVCSCYKKSSSSKEASEKAEKIAKPSDVATVAGAGAESLAVANLIDSGAKDKKQKIAEALLKAVGEGAMKDAVLAAAQPGPLDVEIVYDAALEGAMKGAKVFGANMGAKGVNVAILEASQYAAMVVLSEATKETGRQTVYYGAGSVTQTALAGAAGMAGAINPMMWAAIVGELSGKAVAWATEGDEKVAGLVGAVGAGALAGAYVGASFGPAGTLAGLAGGAAVGTTQHYMGALVEWFLDEAEDFVEDKLLENKEVDEDDSTPRQDGTDWRRGALEKMHINAEGMLQVKLPKPALEEHHEHLRNVSPMLLGGKPSVSGKPSQGSEEEAVLTKPAPTEISPVETI